MRLHYNSSVEVCEPIRSNPFRLAVALQGSYTAHPVGLVVVVGVLLMGLFALPEARWFLASTVLLGSICGFVLWLRHR